MKFLLLTTAALAALLPSCTLPGEGVYGSTSYGYASTHYSHGSDYWHGHHDPSWRSHPRHVRTPFSSKDDERKDADHRTSPHYRDPHHGGRTHGHDAAGHRVDSHGHHVDAVGRHTSRPDVISHAHEHAAPSVSSPSAPEPTRHESSRSEERSEPRGENKMEDIGRRGKD